jgi:RimJ/RimL family protein N-acetyltransferase
MNDRSPAVSIPRLPTERLLLRELKASDFDAFAANLADPAAKAHHTGPVDRPTAWRHFASATGAWMLRGCGWWAIELRETKEFVGHVGCFARDGFPDLEVGWVVVRAFWRRGIATEAARAALSFGLETRCARRVVAHIDPTNEPSLGVAKKLGMRNEGEIDFFDGKVLRFAAERPSVAADVTSVTVRSSMMTALSYDAPHAKLAIEFRSGQVYEYFAVPRRVFEGLRDAESKGRFFRTEIDGVYPFVEVRKK